MEPDTHAEAADRLLTAYTSGVAIPPLSATYEGMTLEDAYAVQLLQVKSGGNSGPAGSTAPGLVVQGQSREVHL